MIKKLNREKIKKDCIETLKDFFENREEEVLRIKDNEIAFPIVDEEGEEAFIKITVAIPLGSRKDNEPFDAYSLEEEYEIKQKLKKEKEEEKRRKKEEKIKKDEEKRRKEKEIKGK